MSNFLLTLQAALAFFTPNLEKVEALCLVEAMYFESVGESYQEKMAVANTILNRAKHKAYPDHVCDVVAQPYQFSYRNSGLYKHHVRPNDEKTNKAMRHIASIAYMAYLGLLKDNTKGATHFVNLKKASPKWASKFRKTLELSHTYYAMR